MHYLPHHGVVCIHLNECLYKGPKFHQLILDPLIRFISYKVALIADVEKAFLMIAVNEKDCDVSDSFGWTMWLKKSLSYVCTAQLTETHSAGRSHANNDLYHFYV